MFPVISSGGHFEICQGTSFAGYFPRIWRAETRISACSATAAILKFVKELLLPGTFRQFGARSQVLFDNLARGARCFCILEFGGHFGICQGSCFGRYFPTIWHAHCWWRDGSGEC